MNGNKAHSGAMVAFFLPTETSDALVSALGDQIEIVTPDTLHVTLAYLGEVADIDARRDDVAAALKTFAAQRQAVAGSLNGIGRFNPSDSSDNLCPIYANVDAADLPEFRQALIDALIEAGVDPVLNHGFTPHVTLTYVGVNAPTPELRLPTTTVTFERLALAWGDERTDYPLQPGKKDTPMKQDNKSSDDARKSFGLYGQTEVDYVTLSKTPGEACAACRWFRTYGDEFSTQDACHIVENYPEAIEPTGWCNRFEARKRSDYQPEPMPVRIVEDDEDDGERAISDDLGVLKKAFNALLAFAGGRGDGKLDIGLKVEGNEWFGVWSNNFEDRESEIFDHSAQDAYIKAVNAGELPMPALKYWHIDHSTHGVATHVGRAGHFMWAKGVFTDDDLGHAFRELYRKSKTPWRMSHGFAYPRRMLVDGVYKAFVTDEITTLPPMAAANFETWFIGGEKLVEVTKDQREALVAAIGDKGNQIADMLNNRGQQLRSSGVNYKDMHLLEDAEARKDIDQIATSQKTMAEAITAMAESVKAVTDGQQAMGEAQKAVGDRVTAVEGDIKEIKELLSMAPRASKHADTHVDEADPELKMLLEKNRRKGRKSIIEQVAAGETPLPANVQDAAEGE